MQASSGIDVYGMAIEDGGFLYLVGSAVNLSGQLPAGSLDRSGGMLDMWVAKLRPDGTPVFQALIGGKADDTAYSVAVRQGVIYVLGETWSTDFPGASGSAGENDALALAVAADGSGILWARRFGGSDQDAGHSIVLSEDQLYLTGITWSVDFQPGSARGSADGFLARLDLSGGLRWMNIFGGSGLDAPFGLAAGTGGIWVTGQTLSTNLAGALFGESDIFALRFSADGAQQFAGLYGGAGEDASYAAALAPDGSLYLTGDTQSANLPNASGQFGGGTDGFLMRIGADGVLKSTSYLGGSEQDSGMALFALPDGGALVAGMTSSSVFPTGYDFSASSLGGQDVFIARAGPSGALVSARRFGGAGEDEARAIETVGNSAAVAGRFSAGAQPYLLLIPNADLPEIPFPTSAPALPTATTAATATSQPTETAGPTITSQPTETLAPTETPRPADTPTTPPVNDPSAAAPTSGSRLAADPASATAAALLESQPAATTAALSEQSEPTSVLAIQSAAGPRNGALELWIGGGLAVIALSLLAVFWLRRKKV